MEINPNDSAFPEIVSEQDGNRVLAEVYSTGGLSIRAYMATKFMSAYIANGLATGNINTVCKLSVAVADELIHELNKK